MINEKGLTLFRVIMEKFGPCKLPDVDLACMHEMLFSNVDFRIACLLIANSLSFLSGEGFTPDELDDYAGTFEYLLAEVREGKLTNQEALRDSINKNTNNFMDWLQWYMNAHPEERQRDSQKRKNRLKLYRELGNEGKMN